MATSMIIKSINSVLDRLAAIPFDWNAYTNTLSNGLIPTTDKPAPGHFLQTLAVWNNQPRQWAEKRGNKPVMPVAYVEFVLGKQMSLGLGTSWYPDAIWKIHLIDEQQDGYNEAGGAAQNNQVIGGLDQNLEIFNWRDLIKTQLEQFFPLYSGCLTEGEEKMDEEHAELYHYILDFKGAFTDLKGGPLDPDQTKIISLPGPIGLVASMGWNNGSTPPNDDRVSYIWIVCQINVFITDTPDPTITQTLASGQVIPVQYATNHDGNAQWVSGTSYAPGNKVNYGNSGYQCTIANSDVAFTAGHWAVIPLQYDTLTIPILGVSPAVAVLTPFMLNGDSYVGVPYASATFDFTIYGGFRPGQNISFNASMPIGATL